MAGQDQELRSPYLSNHYLTGKIREGFKPRNQDILVFLVINLAQGLDALAGWRIVPIRLQNYLLYSNMN